MTWVIPLEYRRSVAELQRRIEDLLPAAERCRDDVASLNELIERRDALRYDPESAEEYRLLNAEVECRLAPFQAVDQEVRAVVSALQDQLLRLPDGPEDSRRQREEIARIPLLTAVKSSLQVNKAEAVRDLGLIRLRLQELVGQRFRPTPAEVIDQLRAALGLSIEALAERADLNPKQIYAVKRGENTTVATLRRLAAVLGCEPGDLVEAAADPLSNSSSGL